MIPVWLELTVMILLWNWAGSWLVSWAYTGILWWRGNVTLEGWVFWRGWFPVARFRLTDKKGWFRTQWESWYGHALLGSMIHRDEVGSFDDERVEETIVHELRHNLQQLALGLLFYVAYGVDFLRVGYRDNLFERDARRATKHWIDSGRPRRFAFGKRR